MSAKHVKRQRKQYASEEVAAIGRKHGSKSVSALDVCDDWGLPPTVVCRWQEHLVEQGAVVFRRARGTESIPGGGEIV